MVGNIVILFSLIVLGTVSAKPHQNKHPKYLKNAIDEALELDPNGCGGKPADLFFLLDTSSSIWEVDFRKQLEFVKNVVELFDIGRNKTRVGVATFSSYYHPRFGMTRYNNKKEIQDAILRIPYVGGETMTGTALRHMRNREFAQHIVRPDIAKIAIVLTDGRSRQADVTAREAQLLKDEGVSVFAIGIGKRFDFSELVTIGSNPSEKYVFEVEGYGALESIKDKLMLRACEVDGPEELMQGDLPVCHGDTLADVMFVFDSLSMGAAKTKQIQNFIGETVKDFRFEDDIMRAGVVSSNCHDGDIYLIDYVDKDEFSKDLRNFEYPDMRQVIQRMRQQSFSTEQGGRDKAERFAVLFVDDKLPKGAYEEIEKAHAEGIKMFVVAVGDAYDLEEVKRVASSPELLIQVPNYDAMLEVTPTLVEGICAGL